MLSDDAEVLLSAADEASSPQAANPSSIAASSREIQTFFMYGTFPMVQDGFSIAFSPDKLNSSGENPCFFSCRRRGIFLWAAEGSH